MFVTEFSAPNGTHTFRTSSRIAAKIENTGDTATMSTEKEQMTRKTVSPKTSVGDTKKRVHDERTPKQNAPNKNVSNTMDNDKMPIEATAKTQSTCQLPNKGKASS